MYVGGDATNSLDRCGHTLCGMQGTLVTLYIKCLVQHWIWGMP